MIPAHHFLPRSEQLMRGFGQKIPFHNKQVNLPLSAIARNHLPVDRMQFVDIRCADLFWRRIPTRKSRCHILYRCTLPRADLRRLSHMLCMCCRQ